jgi:putative transposase
VSAAVTPPSYRGQRYPAAVIAHAVWRYDCRPLSSGQVDRILAQRGGPVTGETIRPWCRTVGQPSASELKRRRPKPGDTGHLDEVFLTIKGQIQ